MLARPALVLALLVLATPVASAVAVQGTLRLAQPPTLEGTVALAAAHGVLDLAPGARPEGWSLSWDRATGYHVEHATTRTATGTQVEASPPRNDSVALGAGSMVAACRARCIVALVADGARDGALALSGAAAPRLAPQGGEDAYYAGMNESGAPDSFHAPVGADWLHAEAEGAAPIATGDLVLFLWNATADVALQEGRRLAFETGTWREPIEGPLGVRPGETIREAFLVLHLRGARLDAAPGAPARLLAPALDARVEGTLRAPEATGVLFVDGARREVRGEPVEVTGLLDLVLGWDEAARLAPLLPSAGPAGGSVGVRGEASEVVVGGWRARTLAPEAVAAAVVAAPLLRLVVWLFSRITPARALENPNRRSLFEAIHRSPGSSVRDLTRASGLAQVVVRHHLRVLRACGMIVVQAEGRRRLAFPVEAAATAAGAAMLRDPTRRDIARLVAEAEEGLTQRDLVERTGLSQRLVSYHLHRLQGAGLVVAREGRPRRWARAQPLPLEPGDPNAHGAGPASGPA